MALPKITELVSIRAAYSKMVNIVLSRISQRKQILHNFTYIWNLKSNKQTYRNRVKKKKEKKQSRMVVVEGNRRGQSKGTDFYL